jgi:hypothetical protein
VRRRESQETLCQRPPAGSGALSLVADHPEADFAVEWTNDFVVSSDGLNVYLVADGTLLVFSRDGTMCLLTLWRRSRTSVAPGRITVKGKGGGLPLLNLPYASPFTVQLLASNGECWQATYAAPVLRDASPYKATE